MRRNYFILIFLFNFFLNISTFKAAEFACSGDLKEICELECGKTNSADDVECRKTYQATDISFNDYPPKDQERPKNPIVIVQTDPEDLKKAQEEAGIDFDLPLIGTIKLIPFEDPETKKSGFKYNMDKPFSAGPLEVKQETIKLIDDKLSITGNGSLFGVDVKFGIKDIKTLEDDWTKVISYTVGVTYNGKPTINLPAGQQIQLLGTDLVFDKSDGYLCKEDENRCPAYCKGNKKCSIVKILTNTNLFGLEAKMGIVRFPDHNNAIITLPKNTPLSAIIPQIKGTILEPARITTAQIEVTNLLSGKNKPSKMELNGFVDLNPKDTEGEEPQSFKGLKISIDFAKAGLTARIDTKEFPIPNIGVIENAKIDIDTTGLTVALKKINKKIDEANDEIEKKEQEIEKAKEGKEDKEEESRIKILEDELKESTDKKSELIKERNEATKEFQANPKKASSIMLSGKLNLNLDDVGNINIDVDSEITKKRNFIFRKG